MHHRFTLTATTEVVEAVCFLWHCPAGHPGWLLATTLPCGARTFLDTAEAVTQRLVPALEVLLASLEKRAKEWDGIVKVGRTHMMDAVPVTLGQEFSGYAAQVRIGIERIEASLPRVAEVPQGGTATGTGINTGAPLRLPAFRRMWTAQLGSNLGALTMRS